MRASEFTSTVEAQEQTKSARSIVRNRKQQASDEAYTRPCRSGEKSVAAPLAIFNRFSHILWPEILAVFKVTLTGSKPVKRLQGPIVYVKQL